MNLIIKQIRKNLKLTQVEFAKRVGVGLRFLRELEQGKPTIRLDKLNQILEFLGCHLEIMRNDKNYVPKQFINSFAYEKGWTKEFKLKIRQRDNFTCQLCGMTESEQLERSSHPLHVHHIDFNKFNHEINNLISLCYICHGKTNGDKEYYQQKLKEIIENKA